MLLKNIRKFSLFFLLLCNICFVQNKINITPLLNKDYSINLLNFIRKAEKSIYVIMFQTGYYPEHPESISNQILEELIKAHKRNIKIEIILELSNFTDVRKKNFETAKFLAENGIKVYFDREDKTTHSKLVIIDNKYIFIGSHNWNYYSLEKNNETSVIIESEEIARVFVDYFNKIKKECKIYIAPQN
ncbi:MAG: phospholipase D-like domain-containing protein [Candidatus Omnitrophica bacterium]|nr:phospholipase D-like domain-containing protein [Candidatus Omnitrophota bacterium]